MLADNKIALNASWDAEMLSLELADLSAIGADLSTMGFTTKELSAALSRVEAGLTDEDEVQGRSVDQGGLVTADELGRQQGR